MDIKDIKKIKIGSHVDWYETVEGRRTGYRHGYKITRVNYKRGLVWGKQENGPLWDHNATQLTLSQIEI